jgi:hypothetical protein
VEILDGYLSEASGLKDKGSVAESMLKSSPSTIIKREIQIGGIHLRDSTPPEFFKSYFYYSSKIPPFLAQ